MALDLEPIKERLADFPQPDGDPIQGLFEVAEIAALIAEVERLRGQIEEAKTLHEPERLYESEENCPHTGKRNSESENHVDDFHIDSSDGYMTVCLAMPTKERNCASCREDDGSEVAYPCPTIRALDGEVESDES